MSSSGRVSAGELEVVFERHEDRIAHTVRLGSGPAAEPILRSHEGRAEQLWPISPPLQQLHIEQRPSDVQVALLVGMAGSSHWSMSCLADPQAKTLMFDVAVRIKRAPQRLGSQYEIVRGVAWDAKNLSLNRHCQIQCEEATTHLDPGQAIMIAPRELPADAPTTVQWRYVLAFSSSAC